MQFQRILLLLATVTVSILSVSEGASAQGVPPTVAPQDGVPNNNYRGIGKLKSGGACPADTVEIAVLSGTETWDPFCIKSTDPILTPADGGTRKRCPLNYALNHDSSACLESPSTTVKSTFVGGKPFCDVEHTYDRNDLSRCIQLKMLDSVRVGDNKPVCKRGYNLAYDDDGKCNLVPRWWLPLKGKNEKTISEFYGQEGSALDDSIAPLNQVSYLYGSETRSLSADLITAYFSNGIAAALGSSVTSGASTTTPDGEQVESQQQALAQLKTGGDFYLKFMYPLAAHSSRNTAQWLFAVPRLGFNFDGFGSQQTITEATEYNVYAVMEYYLQYGSIRNRADNLQVAAFYVDVQGGGEFIPQTLATAVGLKGKTTWVANVAAGIKFFGLLDVGVQRTFRQFTAAPEGANDWHLVVSLLPSGKGTR